MSSKIQQATRQLVQMVERALLGQQRAIEQAVCTFLASGHLLIEDVPGVGKTTLARALARASGGEFRRIQFTSDLLPADITGVSVWETKSSEFSFKPGPIFGNVVLADEINRATPKTQSALLECMSEGRISVDGSQLDLPRPFMVMATQNVEEHHGTYPLPESQLDRFMMCISMGYPKIAAERQVIARSTLDDPVEALTPVIAPAEAQGIVRAIDQIRVDDAIVDYIMELIRRTRDTDLLELGVGPRGGMALHRAARALAFVRDRDYCLIDDIKELAVPVLAHRVIPKGTNWHDGGEREMAARAIGDILASVEIPL